MAIEPRTDAGGRDRREEPRLRTRLRSAKLFSEHSVPLVDCQVLERSAHGARLKLATKIVLPTLLLLYCEINKEYYRARVAWQRELEAGVRLLLHGKSR